MRDWYAILQEIAKADAVSLQGEFHTGSELGEKLVGPARFKIELHVNDITRAPEDLCGFADLSQSLEFLVALMFKELLSCCLDIVSFECIFNSASRVLSLRPIICAFL